MTTIGNKMLDIEDYESQKDGVSELDEDIGVLQYLYYDLQSDLDDNKMQDLFYGESFDDVKECTKIVLEKYGCLGMLDLSVFDGNFTADDYQRFYRQINEVYTKIMNTVGLK